MAAGCADQDRHDVERPMQDQPGAPLLDVVIPVHNEERELERSVRRLDAYLAHHFPYRAQVTIADNASTDGTWELAKGLAAELRSVRALHLDEKGRGRAL